MQFKLNKLTYALIICTSLSVYAEDSTQLDTIQVTAEAQLKQSLGSSEVHSKEIQQQGVANDIAEIVRKQPGVNLTGNSASGQRGNNRQIDIRGMGPENTLILVDGKPVRSRNAVRYSRRGERDTRGDSNWVPAEMIERIDVFRGPSAAHYGDGAAGGVVNIITKKQFDRLSGGIETYYSRPYHKEEGDSRRVNFNLMTPLGEHWGLRLYGNYNKTDADKWYINVIPYVKQHHTLPSTFTAGREGVKNRDANVLLRYMPSDKHIFDMEYGYSRQNNIYAGDSQLSGSSTTLLTNRIQGNTVDDLIGKSTNIMTRKNASLTYTGNWGRISNKSYVQYEWTNNKRFNEGLNGGGEGMITEKREWIESKLRNLDIKSDTFIDFATKIPQTLTISFGYSQAKLNDPNIGKPSGYGIALDQLAGHTDSHYKTRKFSVNLEDNIGVTSKFTVVPTLSFEHHNVVGSSVNPALNLWYNLTENLTLKTGVARAYKSPNIHQLAPNYRLYSYGGGCYQGYRPCYVEGNENLKAESSINSEIGLEYNDDRINTSITYFNNDYRNKVDVGHELFAKAGNTYVFKYYNVPKALVRGLEGTFNWKITDKIHWNNNFTYMMKSENKTTGEKLSITPKYTINSGLGWQIMDALSTQLDFTLYGRQTTKVLRGDGTRFVNGADRASYAIWSISGRYDFNRNFHIRGGVKNIFDRNLYRTGSGANTYNEPGRSYFVGLGMTF
ncbi:FepA family TonB-dependent siderophore receptor [Lonepinella sp. MS14436]|uniref:FepA family TonB-dependent siderophore receptor n=1 Tax=Lonepinella sp. MS14436 TaxID=3003619 RepID=UPI0036DBEAC7